MNQELHIRIGKIGDVEQLTSIYNFYIQNSHATFGTELVSVKDRLKWFDQFKSKGPYRIYVAELENKIIGYVCSFQYRSPSVFSETIETSIYLAPESKGKGIGAKLYQTLFDEIKNEKIHLAVVGIGLPNEGSIALHKKIGFTEVGVFNEYAKVGENYYSSIWMQKKINRE